MSFPDMIASIAIEYVSRYPQAMAALAAVGAFVAACNALVPVLRGLVVMLRRWALTTATPIDDNAVRAFATALEVSAKGLAWLDRQLSRFAFVRPARSVENRK